MNWLGNDIQVGARGAVPFLPGKVFRHGDNGTQEFYEHKCDGFLLGIFRNHAEQFWCAYVARGNKVRTLNHATREFDGKLRHIGPLYRTRNTPRALCAALIRLWKKGGLDVVG